MKLVGRVTFRDLGAGAWVLEAEDGNAYELQGGDGGLLREGVRVEVEGDVDAGAVSSAMLGPALRVRRWKAR
jgi:hypothetical protein